MNFWQILKQAVYETRYRLLSAAIVVLGWIIFSNLVINTVGEEPLIVFISFIAGWYWLGDKVMPWVEQKITPQ